MEATGIHALVTGAASGIGRACAVRLAAEGAARVSLLDVDAAGLAQTARRVEAAGATASIHAVDLADLVALEAAFVAATRDAGPPDLVLNNAGIVTGAPLFPQAEVLKIARIFAVNVSAMVLGTQLAVRLMEGRGGVVINTVSTAHDNAGFRDILYTTSKAAAYQFTRACGQIRESTGVRVCGISPGLVRTPILDTTGGDRRAEWMEPILAHNAALEPEAIAAAVIGALHDDSFVGEVRAVREET